MGVGKLVGGLFRTRGRHKTSGKLKYEKGKKKLSFNCKVKRGGGLDAKQRLDDVYTTRPVKKGKLVGKEEQILGIKVKGIFPARFKEGAIFHFKQQQL